MITDLTASHTMSNLVGETPEQLKDISECHFCAQFSWLM